jgi:hypothetical protein
MAYNIDAFFNGEILTVRLFQTRDKHGNTRYLVTVAEDSENKFHLIFREVEQALDMIEALKRADECEVRLETNPKDF